MVNHCDEVGYSCIIMLHGVVQKAQLRPRSVYSFDLAEIGQTSDSRLLARSRCVAYLPWVF